jgi:glucans biosynthesis protein
MTTLHRKNTVKPSTAVLFGLAVVFLLGFSPAQPLMAAAVTDPEPQAIESPKRFGLADVRRIAEQMARKPFVPRKDTNPLPEYFHKMTYDQFRDIRFRKDHTVWLKDGLPFVLRFFHRGFLFPDPVTINLVENQEARPLEFHREMFDYGANEFSEELPLDMGFAGMQIFYPLRDATVHDEVAVFLGASYFRAVGRDQSWGLSARGLALDTGLEKGEEFPFFREFWIERPDKDATSLTIYALLDSPSITGAYRFVLKPGEETKFDVKAELFPRVKIEKLGIAPLTSMFFHGENKERRYDDFRPEVHDSDGLLLAFGSGEWLWRPLDNHRRLRIRRFEDQGFKGFGLLQRDRDFTHYQDLEAHYQDRPSSWVKLLGDWGKGSVELVEIPTDSERNDNIVAFWVPEKPVEPGQALSVEYRMYFGGESIDPMPGARAIASRVGGSGTDMLDSSGRKFSIDFVGPALKKLPPDAKVEAMVTKTRGEIKNKVVQYNPYTQGWRLYFELFPGDEQEVDLRAFLRHEGDVLSETWSYQWLRK